MIGIGHARALAIALRTTAEAMTSSGLRGT
jgi:hypothetical protein